MSGSAQLARNHKGDVRIDYSMGGVRRTRLWEPIHAGVLETTFRDDGAVILQLSVEKKDLEGRIKETLAEAGCDSARETEYKDVVFDRACPWCSKHRLVRFAEAYRSKGEVPVVPMYQCSECGKRSYYLSDDYLIHLIGSNPHLFEDSDRRRFVDEKEAFVTEVRGNIISIFASKKVRRIE